MEEQLRVILASVAGGRVYWGRKPQEVTATPYVTLQLISGIRDYTMQGPSGYVESRVQCDVYDDSYLGAKGVARQLIGILSGFRNPPILGIFIDGERDLPAADAGEVNHLYRVSIDVMVHHKEN